jgi:aminoglycoside phosphotransferase (APT) family kinase protein
MERKDGFVTPAFQLVGGSNEEFRQLIAGDFVSILVRIHNLDWQSCGFDFLGVPAGGPFDYARASIVKWEKILQEVSLEPDLILTEALLWLKANMPPCEEICLVHGDYKSDNIMYNDKGIVAVFDWEMASLGDPHDDLGWVCMQYYAVDGLLNGMLDREWFLHRYEETSGRRVNLSAVKFWQVFSNLKMAAITLTGLHRYVSGASQKNVLAVLPLLMAKLHRDIIELLEF